MKIHGHRPVNFSSLTRFTRFPKNEAMPNKKRTLLVVVLIIMLSISILLLISLPPFISSSPFKTKPVILYYDYENMPFNASQFPTIVNTTLQHHFNTLMVLVFFNHKLIFNQSTIHYFFSYAFSRNLTFVPSYYVESLSDRFNVSGFPWVNLDMERLSPNIQRFFYAKVAEQGTGTISVTSPYGQPVEFAPSLDIVETYSGTPWFWFLQLAYWHSGHICSIAAWLVHSQQEYDSEKNYCLKYTDGVMVFDYFNLLKSHLN